MSKAAIGIDLGGTFAKTAVVLNDGTIAAKVSTPTDAEKGLEHVLGVMAESVAAALNEAGMSKGDITALAVGAPGPSNWQKGIVYSPPNLPGWKNVPLAEEMEKRLGIKTFIDNDANVACYGEFWLGSGRDVQTMCLLTLGTGVGGGIVIDGKLLRGIDGTAAEIGHLCVCRGGRKCNCGAYGCLEQYASVTGLVKTAIEGIENGEKTLLTEKVGCDLSKITGKMVSDAMNEGDAFSRWVIEETGRWLGTGVGSLINLLNPEMVAFSGGMINAGEPLFSAIRETAQAQSFDVPGSRCQITPATLGEDAGVIGAAGCAIDRFKSEGGL